VRTQTGYCTWFLVFIGLFFTTEVFTGASGKPRLDVEEVIIKASVPALTGGRKDVFSVLETQNAVTSISDTLRRLELSAPGLLPAPDEPFLEVRSGCLAPFLRFGRGTGSHMAKAAQAWEAMRWQDVINSLEPVVTHKETLSEKPAALYFTARSKHYLQDMPGAVETYSILIRDYPQHSYCEYALYSLGWLYFENNDPEKAFAVIDTFSQRFPASPLTPYVRYLRSAIFHKQENYREALRNLEAIIAGYPLFEKMEDVQFWTAENNYCLNRFDAAIQNYTLYLSNYPAGDKRAEAYYGRAFSYLELDQYAESMEDFTTLITTHPDHPLAGDGGFQGGKLAIFMNDTRRATMFFQEALRSYRIDSPRRIEAQAWIDYEGKRFGEAANGFSRAAQIYPETDPLTGAMDTNRAEMLFFEALSLMRNENYAAAVEKFEALASGDSPVWSTAALANAGIVWMKLDRLDTALQHLQKALETPESLPGHRLYALYLAEILYRVNRFDESIARFQELYQADEIVIHRDEILRGIAWNYYAQRNWDQSAEYFLRLIRDYPDSDFHPEALLRRAESLFNKGDYEQSRDVFRELITEYPLHPEAFEARLLNARSDWIRGMYEEGMAGMRETLRFAPDAAHRQRVRMIIGELLQDQEKYAEAIEEFRMAYLEDIQGDGAPAALIRQADNFYNLQENETAAELYRQIIREFPDSDQANLAQYSIGLIYFRQNRLDQYLAECLSMSRNHPGTRQSALALNGAASILIEQNRFDEATDVLTELKNHYQQHVDEELIRFRLGQTLKRSGNLREAEQEFHALIDLSPTGRYAADAMIEIAEIAAGDTRYTEALDSYRYILEIFTFHPRRIEVISRAAALYADQENWEPSARLWRRYIEELGDSSDGFEGHLELGRVLLRSGDLDQARRHAEIAMRSMQRKIIAEAHYLLSEIIELQGDIDEALKGYLKIGYVYSDQQETVFKAHVRAALLLHEQGRKSQAESLINRARAQAETDEQRRRLSEVCRQIGLTGGAE
jgi:TolA-binding protein